MRLLGYKTLRLRDGEINSLVRPGRWNKGRLVATCFDVKTNSAGFPISGCAHPPGETCACGIWGCAPYPDVAINYLTAIDRFLCVVQGIGKSTLTKNDQQPRQTGFRTKEAKIVAVLLPDPLLYKNHTSLYYVPPLKEIYEVYEEVIARLSVSFIDPEAADALVASSWDWWRNGHG